MILLGSVALLSAWKGMAVNSLIVDPVNTAELRWQTGFLYKISILIWGAITASCLLGAATWKHNGAGRAFHAFLLTSAALTLFFALDDVFQSRAEFSDHLGLPEVAMFAIYAAVLCVFAIVFGSTMLRTEYVVLAAAATLLVVWLVLRHFGVERVAQDGIKLVGQLTLLLYFFRTSSYGVGSR
jgi:hypothetical protein